MGRGNEVSFMVFSCSGMSVFIPALYVQRGGSIEHYSGEN